MFYLKKAEYTRGSEITDHTFVSDGIRVNDFKVLSKEVSGHLPLQLNFNIIEYVQLSVVKNIIYMDIKTYLYYKFTTWL